MFVTYRSNLSYTDIERMLYFVEKYKMEDTHPIVTFWDKVLINNSKLHNKNTHINIIPSNTIIYNGGTYYVKFVDLYEIFITYTIRNKNPNMLNYIGWFRLGNDYYLLSEYVDIQLLDGKLINILNRSSFLSFLKQLFYTLHELYQKHSFVHNDLYQNVFINGNNTVIIDFEFSTIRLGDRYYVGSDTSYAWFIDIIHFLYNIQLTTDQHSDIINTLLGYFDQVKEYVLYEEDPKFTDKIKFEGNYAEFLSLLYSLH